MARPNRRSTEKVMVLAATSKKMREVSKLTVATGFISLPRQPRKTAKNWNTESPVPRQALYLCRGRKRNFSITGAIRGVVPRQAEFLCRGSRS